MRYLIKLKVLFSISLLSISSLSLITLTSCKNDLGDSDEIYQYIYDRTFSIARVDKNKNAIIGTGWLIKHVGNYRYEMFTNWHVENSQEAMPNESYYCYGIETQSLKFGGAISDYRQFDVKYDGYAKYYDKSGISLGVDAAIATVDFNNSLLTAFLKSRLDSLNAYADLHGSMLVKLASKHLEVGDNIYIAGYPVKNWDGDSNNSAGSPCWYGGEDIVGDLFEYFQNKKKSHNIDESEPATKYSIADEYVLREQETAKPRNNLFHVGAGASGSMALNKDMELVGLYWGGFTDSADKPKYFAPSVESFFSFTSNKSPSYSLYDDYKNGKWLS